MFTNDTQFAVRLDCDHKFFFYLFYKLFYQPTDLIILRTMSNLDHPVSLWPEREKPHYYPIPVIRPEEYKAEKRVQLSLISFASMK
jgi:hypothetical protein